MLVQTRIGTGIHGEIWWGLTKRNVRMTAVWLYLLLSAIVANWANGVQWQQVSSGTV